MGFNDNDDDASDAKTPLEPKRIWGVGSISGLEEGLLGPTAVAILWDDPSEKGKSLKTTEVVFIPGKSLGTF
jgi:hypothetical protein